MPEDEEKHYFGECPKCKWRTRELFYDEIDFCKQGSMRCSGTCIASAVPNQPATFSPRLKLIELKGGAANGND